MPAPFSGITVAEMRERFNRGKYWERMQAGEFIAVGVGSRRPRPVANEPAGTISQIVSYRDPANDEVALVRQYLRPDGSLGAHGRPDPKRLFEGGVLYHLQKKNKNRAIIAE